MPAPRPQTTIFSCQAVVPAPNESAFVALARRAAHLELQVRMTPTSAKAKECQDGDHDNYQADNVNDAVHTAFRFSISTIFGLRCVPGHCPGRALQVYRARGTLSVCHRT